MCQREYPATLTGKSGPARADPAGDSPRAACDPGLPPLANQGEHGSSWFDAASGWNPSRYRRSRVTDV